MTKRLSLILIVACLAIKLPADAHSATKHDNIIIDDELRVFTINEKNGVISSVKSESDSYYEALRNDDYADAVAAYNDNISIDKASAPGAKPYYRSWESDDVFYDGVRVCYMRVPLAKGKKSKVTFHQTYKRPEHFCKIVLPSNTYKKRHSKIVIKVPEALVKNITVTPYRLSDNITLSSETLANGSMVYMVEACDLAPWVAEEGAPSASVAAPQIVVTGQFADANALYRHFRHYYEEPDLKDEEISRIAGLLKQNANDREALVDSTAAWVRRNIRYLAVEHGEYAFRPATAAEVIRSRAGDCKGSANLIKALLKKNGLDGRLAWIGTRGDVPFDWDKVPALCSGNHVIAACMLGDSIIYLDGTTAWSSPGYIPPSIRGRSVMIENGDDCIITNVTDSGQEHDFEHISANYRIEGDDLIGDVRIELSGVNRMAFLSSLYDTEPRDRQNKINRYLAYPKKNSDVANARIEAALSENIATLRGTVKENNGARRIGDKIYVDLKPLRDALFTVCETKERTHDFVLPFGYASTYEYRIALPENYRLDAVPEPVSIDNDWYEASLSYTEDSGTIRCRATVRTKEPTVALDRIAERNEAVKALRRASDSQIVLVPMP